MKKIMLILLAICIAKDACAQDQVIVLHGIARDSDSMEEVADFLQKKGYQVHNIDYPSTDKYIDMLADYVHKETEQLWGGDKDKLHFVGYSMGNILIRALIEKYNTENLGRVVMIAPPNKGSEVADFLEGNVLYKYFYGPAGQELGTNKNITPNKLPDNADYELGIIAGDRSIDPISSIIIPGTDDGKVAVERTKLKGMKDHIIVHATHTFIINDDNVLEQTYNFLQNGKFE